MTLAMLRRSLTATAVLVAIAAPSALASGACGGSYTPPPPKDPGTPTACVGKKSSSSYDGHRHRSRRGRDCQPPPVFIPPPPPVEIPPVDPPVGF